MFHARLKEATAAQLAAVNESFGKKTVKEEELMPLVDKRIKRLFTKSSLRQETVMLKDQKERVKVIKAKNIQETKEKDFAPAIAPRFNVGIAEAPPKIKVLPKKKQKLNVTGLRKNDDLDAKAVQGPSYVSMLRDQLIQKDRETVQLAYKNMKKIRHKGIMAESKLLGYGLKRKFETYSNL